MKYFETFTSNTLAGSGNQMYFTMPEGEVRRGRIFYKITVGGEYRYSILFSNIIDSTFSDGTVSHKNLICDSWTLLGARMGRCRKIPGDKPIPDMTVADEGEGKQADILVSGLTPMTFDGKRAKEVMPGEFFASDPMPMQFEDGEYLCLEITFSGKMIPYHEETLLPVFLENGGRWEYSKLMPFAGMIGCDRAVKGRIAYLGDSITQGIGTELNSYAHWNAVLSRRLGKEYAYWNLGLGYGRAEDAASDGAWLYKAKQNDVVLVCYGVNDLLHGSAARVKEYLTVIAECLAKAKVRTVVQTVPPFDYSGDTIKKWEDINRFIRTELSEKVSLVFDDVPVLRKSKSEPYAALFGGHPNAEGCRVWADALYSRLAAQGLAAQGLAAQDFYQ